MIRPILAAAVSSLVLSAVASPVTISGEDIDTKGHPAAVSTVNSSSAQATFLSHLEGVGTKTFEAADTYKRILFKKSNGDRDLVGFHALSLVSIQQPPSPLPEPASWSLVLTCIAALAWVSRRWSRRVAAVPATDRTAPGQESIQNLA